MSKGGGCGPRTLRNLWTMDMHSVCMCAYAYAIMQVPAWRLACMNCMCPCTLKEPALEKKHNSSSGTSSSSRRRRSSTSYVIVVVAAIAKAVALTNPHRSHGDSNSNSNTNSHEDSDNSSKRKAIAIAILRAHMTLAGKYETRVRRVWCCTGHASR